MMLLLTLLASVSAFALTPDGSMTCSGQGGFLTTGKTSKVSLTFSTAGKGAKMTITMGSEKPHQLTIMPYPTKGGPPGLSSNGAVSFAIRPDGDGTLRLKYLGKDGILKDEFTADSMRCH